MAAGTVDGKTPDPSATASSLAPDGASPFTPSHEEARHPASEPGQGQGAQTGPQPGRPAVFGFAGWSGSGKTTLLEQLIPRFTQAGLTVSVIKHAHHRVDIDKPGKDSWRHREAGATEVLVTTDQRWALMHELRGAPEPTLDEHLSHMSPCDLVLVEGFKAAPIAKIEVHRPSVGKPLLHPDDASIVAIATDETLSVPLPVLDIDDPDAVVAFILQQTGLKRPCTLCGAGAAHEGAWHTHEGP